MEKNNEVKTTGGRKAGTGQPLLGDVNGGSILLDRLDKEFYGETRNSVEIDDIWYVAKPYKYRTGRFFKRLLGAWYVLTGFSIAVHFAEDERKIRH